jgi:glycosyltransferase involved in cell wall biosynthesis
MRVLVNAFAAREGGAKWFTEALIQKLAEQNANWHFVVYCTEQDFMSGGNSWPNVELRYVPRATGYAQRILWQQWKLRRVIKEDRISVVFSPLCIGIFLASVPQVTVQRNAHHLVAKVKKQEGGQWLRRRMQLLATLASIKSSTENVFVSKYMVDLASRWLRPDAKHWHVIYNAVNREFFSGGGERVIDRKYLLCAGALVPHKNVDTLIKAFELVCRESSEEIKLVLAGSGAKTRKKKGVTWEEYLFNLAKTCGLQDRVIFMGDVQHKKLISLYKYAEVCVVPSLLESFGIVPAEALCCGTPCVVSDIPAFREIYGDTVLYCDPNKPAVMADAIIRVLQNKGLRSKLVENGKALLAKYDISDTAQQYAQIIKRAALNK